MTDNIFDAPADHGGASLFENLVGEGKKFKTTEELARGKVESDRFIEQLKAEMTALKDDLAARVKLEEVIDRLTSRENENPYEPPYQEQRERSSQPAINSDDIDRLIETKITNRDKERTAKQNRDLAVAKLKEVYGADYSKRLEEKCEALGIDKDTLNSLAARSPTAFLELVLPKGPGERSFTPPRSSVASEHTTPNTSAQPGTKAWYDNLRKSDPTNYWSTKTQWKMHQDAIKAANEGRNF